MAKAKAVEKEEEKATTKEKPIVTVHEGLFKLIKQEREAAEQAATYMVAICETVSKDNVSNAQLIKTIMEARGIAEASARGVASRIRSLLKDDTSLQKLRDGEVTVRAAVKSAQTRQAAAGPKNKKKAFDRALNSFVAASKALGQDKKTLLVTVEAAFDEAKIK
jgi:hypothetical protein